MSLFKYLNERVNILRNEKLIGFAIPVYWSDGFYTTFNIQHNDVVQSLENGKRFRVLQTIDYGYPWRKVIRCYLTLDNQFNV